jgi:hypothetical protein
MRVLSVLIAVLFVAVVLGCSPAKKQAPAAAKDSVTVKDTVTAVVDTAKKAVDTAAVKK